MKIQKNTENNQKNSEGFSIYLQMISLLVITHAGMLSPFLPMILTCVRYTDCCGGYDFI